MKTRIILKFALSTLGFVVLSIPMVYLIREFHRPDDGVLDGSEDTLGFGWAGFMTGYFFVYFIGGGCLLVFSFQLIQKLIKKTY